VLFQAIVTINQWHSPRQVQCQRFIKLLDRIGCIFTVLIVPSRPMCMYNENTWSVNFGLIRYHYAKIMDLHPMNCERFAN